MLDEELTIDGRLYYFDLNEVCKFISYTTEKNSKEKEIIDSYEENEESEGLRLSNKVVREITTPNESQYDNIKYDLVKTFIIQLITYNNTVNTVVEGNNFDLPILDATALPFGTRLVFNTLIEMGILKERK